MNLYLKYRPNSLDDIFGNSQVIEPLKNMLENSNKCPHVFLFSGPKGCGKTTLGRIVLDSLHCQGNDLREINTADFRGIDSVRDIIKNSRFKPLEGASRGWLIDECHKLTSDAQNALLKILEDTPSHVYFVFCTTDPQKLIAPLKDRCQQFQVNPLSDMQMMKLLKKVVRAEGKSMQRIIFEQIIQDSQGHPRRALQILDQVLMVDSEKQLEMAKQSAEKISQSIELCRALLTNAGWKKVQNILNGLKDEEDSEKIRRHVLGYCQSVLLKDDNEKAGRVMEEFLEPFYNTGFPGLVYACYSIIKN